MRSPTSRGGRRAPAPTLPRWQAVALGALHGPAELLPISSSGHMATVPWLLGWSYAELDGEQRKRFEVALHAATAAALALATRRELGETRRAIGVARAALLAIPSVAPAALIGWALERPIERRLGTPAATAIGLLGGTLAIALADRAPEARCWREARPADAAWLGIAQALALFPGVSRSGTVTAAARFRRFTREDASRLSRHTALPVIAGAALLKAGGLRRRPLEPALRVTFAAGVGASFCSTLLCARLLLRAQGGRWLLACCLYRAALAGAVLRRVMASRETPRRRRR
jgi:undecaprenyl-diphosphatase